MYIHAVLWIFSYWVKIFYQTMCKNNILFCSRKISQSNLITCYNYLSSSSAGSKRLEGLSRDWSIIILTHLEKKDGVID